MNIACVAGIRQGKGEGEFEREAQSWDWEGERLPWRYCFFHSAPSRLLVICYMSGCQNYPIRSMPLFVGKPSTARTTIFVINIGTPSHLSNCQGQFCRKTPPPCTMLIFPSTINLPVTQHCLRGWGGGVESG